MEDSSVQEGLVPNVDRQFFAARTQKLFDPVAISQPSTRTSLPARLSPNRAYYA